MELQFLTLDPLDLTRAQRNKECGGSCGKFYGPGLEIGNFTPAKYFIVQNIVTWSEK